MNKIYVDFEMNMSNSKSKRDINNSDIIAIGAVKYNVNTESVDTFKSLIRPVSNISIYPHIEELTKITNEDILDAPCYEEVMRDFKKWLGNFSEIEGIYTFGNLDLTCFTNTDRRSAQKNNHPRFVNNIRDMFIDIKEEYIKKGIRCINYVSLKKLLECSNVEFDGDAHDPLADAYNLLILDKTLSNRKDIRELLIIKDIVKNPFIEINTDLEEVFESYKNSVHNNSIESSIEQMSIEVLKTLKYYIETLVDVDIYNIEILKDIEKKLYTFEKLIGLRQGYFFLIENIYLDMKDLLEDLMYYRLNQSEYEKELKNILDLFEEDMAYENIYIDKILETSC
ncbi:MAG: exonuclease domain-containing protein [Peptostreptococcaceae bacterium]|jgi:inhibitor of KinA sporulation pathway (predicted exonuclease)|nr:exonuclease domain-containing protein [Peptostreptococcaceae bacterium]